MRIVDLETFVVANPPPSFGGRYFVFVKLTSDDGLVGWGEAYNDTVGPHVMAAVIADVGTLLDGASPFETERFFRRAYGRGFTQRPDVTVMGAASALEMACWDLAGKAVGRPAHELLGGRVRDRLRAYTYLYPEPGDANDVYADPDLAAARAAEEVARGFTAVKFDPAGPYTVMGGHMPSLARIELSVRFCAALRDAVGDRADLLFGTHGQFTPGGATRLARWLEPYDPLWFEEPVPPDDIPGLAQVARSTTVPVATGERLTTRYEFARVLEARAASILQPNLGRVGGLLEGRKIATMAEAFGAQIAPHLYCGPIVGAANVQLAACSPNFLVLESIRDWSGFHAEILRSPMPFEDGHVLLPDAPGLGVEVDEEVARAHPYEDSALHLDMAQEPIDESDPLV